MTADAPADYAYQPVPEPLDPKQLRRYWNVAMGLQAVDGLRPSPYLRDLAKRNVAGELSLAETGELIKRYHSQGAESTERQNTLATGEADLVSQRIAEILAARRFFFMPDILSTIHRELFQDMDESTYHPGEYKTEALMKQETILNGDSVVYADPSLIEQSLSYLFTEEREAYYGIEFDQAGLNRFSTFVAHVWQVHPFVEGNTRVVAVFAELYLDQLGFNVTNDPFEQNARYFRDALVRANYRNVQAGIRPQMEYVEQFFDSLLNGVARTFDSNDLVCQRLYEDPSLLRNVDPSQALTRKLIG